MYSNVNAMPWQVDTAMNCSPSLTPGTYLGWQYNNRKESGCASALNNTNSSNFSASFEDLNNVCKQTTSSRLSSEHDKDIAVDVVSLHNLIL